MTHITSNVYKTLVLGDPTATLPVYATSYANPLIVDSGIKVMPTSGPYAVSSDTAGVALTNNGSLHGGYVGSAGGIGVDLTLAGKVVNTGAVAGGNAGGAGVGGAGVSMHGGSLTNGTKYGAMSTITGGTASGTGAGGVGVALDGGSLTTYSKSSIAGGDVFGKTSGPSGDGVDLTGGAKFTNAGLVNAGATDYSTGGIALNVGVSSVVYATDGEIRGGQSAFAQGGAAVVLAAGSQLTNDERSHIYGGSGGGSSSAGVGVELLEGDIDLRNYGYIRGGGSDLADGAAGVDIAVGGSLFNLGGFINGGSSKSGVGGAGVYLHGGEVATKGLISGGQGAGGVFGAAVEFGNPYSVMKVEQGAQFYSETDSIGNKVGDITGFKLQDKIWFTDLNPVTLQGEFDASNTLTTGLDGNLHFVGSYTHDQFVFTADPFGGTDITVTCFKGGTHILTPRGEIPVEKLCIGDEVTISSGAARPIRWIGRRVYDGRLAAGNRELLPVLIRRNALRDGIPLRDLWVSPTHALLVDGVLIPARALINGRSILQEDSTEDLSYFHLEFDSHEIVVAEGAWAESYVDDDTRGQFDNAAQFAQLYPHRVVEPAAFCAPRAEEGEELERIRDTLSARAYAPNRVMRPSLEEALEN